MKVGTGEYTAIPGASDSAKSYNGPVVRLPGMALTE